MKHYEMLSILPGTLTEEEAQGIAGQIKETLEKNGAKNIAQEYNGKSRLAYPMKHIRYGYFFVSTFETSEAEIEVIQAKVRLMNQILRTICRAYNPDQKVSLSLGETAPTTQEEMAVASAPEAAPAPMVEEVPETVEETVSESAPEETPKADTKEDISMEEIDQKLDELLEKGM